LEIEGQAKLAISLGTPKIDAGYFTTMGVLVPAEGQYDLGYFDGETWRLEPIENPFGPKCYLCLRNDLLPM
jgi:hypothetical protein